ncbi:MAG: SDR family oxidoreductase [Pirellulales bacterium]|nr:SDR family oxidoreductase [Pirellulales bacterium]
MERVQQRHIIVSGGSRGLGQALVEGLLGAGYPVSTFSRSATDFTNSQADNPHFHFASADIADREQVAEFLITAEEKFGLPFGLVNCAGIAVDGVLATLSEDQIERVVDINLVGALVLSRRVVRRMLLGKQGGSIINISSIIGIRGYNGLSAYAATKGGMDAMTRSLARELGDRRIRVNSIAPGYLATEMTHGLSDSQRQQVVRRTPLGRLGTPQDVVGPVKFLLSDEAEFITGQVLVVDGGITV